MVHDFAFSYYPITYFHIINKSIYYLVTVVQLLSAKPTHHNIISYPDQLIGYENDNS